MSWNVITRDELNFDDYAVLPFGRHSDAEPFVQALISSEDTVSDLVESNTSNSGALKRAIIKLSGVDVAKRNSGKKTKKGKAIMLPVYDADTFAKACNTLAITLEKVASKSGGTDYVQIRKVSQ